MKQYRITLPVQAWAFFPDDEPIDSVKEALGEIMDELLVSTDYMSDLWKMAQVEEV